MTYMTGYKSSSHFIFVGSYDFGHKLLTNKIAVYYIICVTKRQFIYYYKGLLLQFE